MDCRGRALGEVGSLGLTDVEVLKHGEQTGLETPVVHALNDDYLLLVFMIDDLSNELINPPE